MEAPFTGGKIVGLRSTFPRHGGDLSAARNAFGSPPAGWLDLSTGVNPWPYPHGAIDPATLTRLPQNDAMEALLAAARERVWHPAGQRRGRGAGKSGDNPVAPRHAAAIPSGRVGADVRGACAGVAAFGPSGGRGRLLARSPRRRRRGGGQPQQSRRTRGRPADAGRTPRTRWRERAVGSWWTRPSRDVAPEASLASMANLPDTLIIRSFGKFFGLPGLRLGFVAGPPALGGVHRAASRALGRLGPRPGHRPAGADGRGLDRAQPASAEGNAARARCRSHPGRSERGGRHRPVPSGGDSGGS